jgi:metal-responsive CopG/Arc/MetJ family transcriptional regulator
MKRKNYYLPDQLLTLLRKRMKADGLSASELVRRALEAYLKPTP